MVKLIEGYYKANDSFYRIVKSEKGKFSASDASGNAYPLDVEYGDFGEADPEVQKRSGMKNYNVKLTINYIGDVNEEDKKDESEKKKMEFVDLGVVYAEGMKCSMKGMVGVSGLEKISEEEYEEIMNDFDPIEAPPGPYKLQPGKKGRIVWLTGAPGMGKSTSAQILARNQGYVYYEADCFMALKNPYVPLDVPNPSMAQMYQKVLKGPGMEKRKAVIKTMQSVWGDLMAGNEYDKEKLLEFYHHMAADIAREKKRIGGDFAIAHVLLTADIRAAMRELLGPDLVIIVLTMTSTDRRERILARHSGDSNAADMMDHFETLMERVQEDEPNTFELNVTSSMTKDEVVAEISKIIEELAC